MIACDIARPATGGASDIAAADERFLEILEEGTSDASRREAQRDYFIAEYAAYVYRSSHAVYRSRVRRGLGDDDVDRVRSAAIEAIETIARSIEEGRLGFRGRSRFSTYVFGVVKWKVREALEDDGYVPKEVRDMGGAAEALFKAIAFDRFDAETAVCLVAQSTGRPEPELGRLRRALGPAIGKWSASVGARARDARSSLPESVAADLAPSTSDPPDEEFARRNLREACEEVLRRMPPRDAETIERRFVLGQSIEELRTNLGLDKPQAARNRVFRARKAFVREARRLGLEGLFRAFLDGGGL